MIQEAINWFPIIVKRIGDIQRTDKNMETELALNTPRTQRPKLFESQRLFVQTDVITDQGFSVWMLGNHVLKEHKDIVRHPLSCD